jgi:type I restriction enzyme S subunit
MDEWPSVELRTLIEPARGISYGIVQPGTAVSDGVPIVRVSDVRNGQIRTDSPLRVSRSIETAYARTRLRGGELLITIVGTVGETAIVPNNLAGWNVARAIAVLPVQHGIGAYWVKLALRSAAAMATIGSRLNTTVQATLNLGDLAKLPILIPPPQERRRITTILSALDHKIDLNRRMNDTLETMARTIFKDWFVDFGPTRTKMEGREPYLSPDIWSFFPDRLDDEGKPKGWQIDRLGTFTDLQNGYAFKSSDWQDDGIPVVKIGSVKPSVVDLSEVSFISPALAKDRAAFQLNVGDVLVGLTGYVGETGRVPPTGNPPMLNQRVARFSSSKKFSPFVFSCVRDPAFKLYAEGKGHGSAQANVSTKDLLDYPVINSPAKVVGAFEEVVGSFFAKSLANLGEISELAVTRDLLLPKLISGEIRIKDAEKMVEAVL